MKILRASVIWLSCFLFGLFPIVGIGLHCWDLYGKPWLHGDDFGRRIFGMEQERKKQRMYTPEEKQEHIKEFTRSQ